jgi:quercetin dioxygenase-like cupin family protein
MDESDEISTKVGTKLLFENDRVRVWDLCLPPGERIETHQHEYDYLYVVIGGGELQTEFPDGSSDPPREMHDGDVRFREVDGRSIHAARNVGQTPWRNIVVELKS